ncbi:MAG: winged helix-turn-helix domain-containing protein, partial [Blastocatellia bacterium]
MAVPLKTFEALQILIQHRPEVLEKDDLIKLLWPDTFVEEINLTVHISRLRKILGEEPGDHKYIVTIPKRGYGFVAPVDEVPLESVSAGSVVLDLAASAGISEPPLNRAVSQSETSQFPDTASSARNENARLTRSMGLLYTSIQKRLRRVLAAAVVVILLAFAYFFSQRFHPSDVEYQYWRIGVLQFRSISVPDDEYLAAGIANGVFAKLVRLPDLTVKHTAFISSIPDEANDSLTQGRKLNVDVVLDGQLEQVGEGLQLKARLLRVRDGKALWVARFDITPARAIDVQDSIYRQLVNLLGQGSPTVGEADLVKHETRSAAAYEAYIRGLYFWNTRTNDG